MCCCPMYVVQNFSVECFFLLLIPIWREWESDKSGGTTHLHMFYMQRNLPDSVYFHINKCPFFHFTAGDIWQSSSPWARRRLSRDRGKGPEGCTGRGYTCCIAQFFFIKKRKFSSQIFFWGKWENIIRGGISKTFSWKKIHSAQGDVGKLYCLSADR